MEKSMANDPPLHPPIANELEVSKDVSFVLRFSRPSEGLTVLRFLLTKIFRKEVLTSKEESLFYLTVEWTETLRRDTFGKKSEAMLQTLRQLSKLYMSFRNKSYPTWAEAQIEILRTRLLSPRAYLGLKTKFVTERYLKRINRRLKRRPPPQRYIGVGYRDKGTAKVDSHDGTPHWQQVYNPLDELRVDYKKPKEKYGEIQLYQDLQLVH
jgi:hypothetical protein